MRWPANGSSKLSFIIKMGLKRVQAKKRLMNTSQGNARSIFPLALLPHVYIIRSAEKRKGGIGVVAKRPSRGLVLSFSQPNRKRLCTPHETWSNRHPPLQLRRLGRPRRSTCYSRQKWCHHHAGFTPLRNIQLQKVHLALQVYKTCSIVFVQLVLV